MDLWFRKSVRTSDLLTLEVPSVSEVPCGAPHPRGAFQPSWCHQATCLTVPPSSLPVLAVLTPSTSLTVKQFEDSDW